MGGSRVAVLIPVKGFATAKVRLAAALDASERAALARSMAETVVAAASPFPVGVACDDPEVAEWAATVGASVIWTPGVGLDGAVSAGVAAFFADGFDLVVVSHADLPRATTLAPVTGFDGITLVPDRRDDGTNVVALPRAAAGFRFAYGPGSFARHEAEAHRLGVPLRIVRIPALQWDVDTPDDLEVPTATATCP